MDQNKMILISAAALIGMVLLSLLCALPVSRRKKLPLTKGMAEIWSDYSFIAVFVVIFLAYWWVTPTLKLSGAMNILRHSAVIGIMALGMGLVVITGQIDLSVGSMLAFIGGLTVLVFNQTNNIAFTVIAALGIGAACGLLNGVLVGKAKMPAFIVTLATMLIFRSVIRYVCHEFKTLTGGSNSLFKLLNANSQRMPLFNFGNSKVFEIPMAGLILIVLTIVIVYITTSTKFGKQLYAVGSNERAARLAGINVDNRRIAVFVISGVLTGISAFLWVAMNASVDPATTGVSNEMYAIAAVVLGGISMAGGRGKCLGILFGVMSYTVIDKIITAMKMNTLIQDGVKGAILILVIIIQTMSPVIKEAFTTWKMRRQTKKA